MGTPTSISRSLKTLPGSPSTLRKKGDAAFSRRSDDILIRWLFLLTILKLRVDEPIVVNTVSKSTESVEKLSEAEGSSMKVSFFLQEPEIRTRPSRTGSRSIWAKDLIIVWISALQI